MTRTSSISGTFSRAAPLAGQDGGREQLEGGVLGAGRATVPRSGRPPSIRNVSGGGASGSYSQWKGLASAID